MYSNDTNIMSGESRLKQRRLILYSYVVLAVAGDLKQAILGDVGRSLDRQYH